MAPSVTSPYLSKIGTKANTKSKKKENKARSSIADELFRRGRPAGTLDIKKYRLSSKLPVLNRPTSRIPAKQTPLQSHKPRGHKPEDEDSDGDIDVAANGSHGSRYLARFDAEIEEDDDMSKSCSEPGESDEDEEDWLDGSTLIAPYQDEESETEEERALALVEYLQVPMQEKSHTLKQDLCNALIATINEVRQAQDKVERGADVDRGKGIIHFNDACDKRHVDTSRAHAQLKDSMSENQAEIKKLFVQLKQAYDRRSQLWVDLKARINEITDRQAAVLDQLDDSMARTVTALEKKSKTMLKDNSGKDKETLLRGMLGRM